VSGVVRPAFFYEQILKKLTKPLFSRYFLFLSNGFLSNTMEIPVYTSPEAGNAITEGEFEITGFRSFIRAIVEEELYDKEKYDGLFKCVLAKGTADLSPEEMETLDHFIAQYNSICKRCGQEFKWDEMDPRNEVVYCSACRYELAQSED